jgi:hypothetical protein
MEPLDPSEMLGQPPPPPEHKKRGRKRKEISATNSQSSEKSKPPKKRRLYIKHMYGDPLNPKDSDILSSTLNYSLTREGDYFYYHPLSEGCVVPIEQVRQDDPSRLEIYYNRLNLRPMGSCMHCDRDDFEERVVCAIDYDYSTEQYVVWGNFCGFPCNLRYALERFGSPYIIMLNHKMAAELWGINEPIRPAPPKVCFKKYFGHVDPHDVEMHSKKYNARIHEGSCVSYAMMVECQPLDDNGNLCGPPDDISTELSRERKIRTFNIRGLRAPRNNNPATNKPLVQQTQPNPPVTESGKEREQIDTDEEVSDSELCLFEEFVRENEAGGSSQPEPIAASETIAKKQNPSAQKNGPKKIVGNLASFLKSKKKK